MKVAFVSDHDSPFMSQLTVELRDEFASRGHEVLPDTPAGEIPPDINIVFNVTDSRAPRVNYLRASSSNFVCTIAETDDPSEDLRKEAYTVLVKTISNLLAYAVHAPGNPASYLVTPELGFREVRHGNGHAQKIADQVLGIADVHFVIENELVEDLPSELHEGDAITAEMARVAKKLDGLGLLPSVLPLNELLSERERRMLQKIFGVKQLSYGNQSARRDRDSFWMSARGVDKSNLRVIGRDLLLVTGYEADQNRLRLSVPPGTDPTTRVSVDAIEHYLLYKEFPEIGAIIHVHAWLPGIESTLQNYPCGSYELADEVMRLARREPDPANAVIGLKNHGVTVTGPSSEAIYEQIAPKLQRQVPMV